jgi:type IV pilus assembly protein PilP
MMRIVLLLLSVGMILGLSACDEKPQKKKTTVRPRPVAKKIVEVVQKEEEAPIATYVYVVGQRRDPFTSLLKIRKPLQDESEPLTPLQQFGLKELRLSAIVVGKGEPKAMVVAPDKKAYFLSAGVKVGRNQGVVREIATDGVIVEERFRDFSGEIRTEIEKITLPNREGE